MTTQIKSHIDWNELFPLLPQTLKDNMLLEAVTILSAGARKVRRHRRSSVGGSGDVKIDRLPDSLRNWTNDGDGKFLAAKGRHYRIIASKHTPRPATLPGKVWAKLLDHKGDFVSYEVMIKYAGDKLNGDRVIAYLWRTGRLEVAKGPNEA